jgi:hypothetical protein
MMLITMILVTILMGMLIMMKMMFIMILVTIIMKVCFLLSFQMVQMLNGMPAPQRAQFAQSLGMSPEQLTGFMQMVSSLPPDQLQNMMSSMGRGIIHVFIDVLLYLM